MTWGNYGTERGCEPGPASRQLTSTRTLWSAGSEGAGVGGVGVGGAGRIPAGGQPTGGGGLRGETERWLPSLLLPSALLQVHIPASALAWPVTKVQLPGAFMSSPP